MEAFSTSLALVKEIHRIPLTKASDTEQTVEKTIETPMIWDAIVIIMTS